MKFADVPPLDRWEALSAYLDQLESRIGSADPAQLIETVEVSELAEQGKLSVGAMVNRLQRGGGKPFKLGKVWVIRKTSLAEYYLQQERGAA